MFTKIYKRTDKVFIVAPGSSLTDFDFKRLEKHHVIVINRVAEHVKKWDLVSFIDVEYTYNNIEYWKKIFDGRPVYTDHMPNTGTMGLNLQIYQPSNLFGFSMIPPRVSTGSNSGYAALNIAYHKGARNIYLLGFDGECLNGKRYFFDYEEKVAPGLHPDYKFIDWSGFKLEAPEDLKITNCSLNSWISAFPKKDINEIL